MISWLSKHKFESYLVTFVLMILTSIGLYFGSNSGSATLIWGFLVGFVLANGLAILVK
jgi:heme/copper-type cytochrome/quinol oxidase subunit 4